jgi:sugar phosphate isomerase/epimerase
MNIIKGILIGAIVAASSSLIADVSYKLGIAGYTFIHHNADKALDILKSIDCHYLCIKDKHCDYRKGAAAPIAEFKQKCAKAGVQCVAAGPLYFDNEPAARKLFEFAKAYGIKTVTVVPFSNKKNAKGKLLKCESEESLDILEKLVKEFDIKAGIHNHGPDMPELYPTAESIWARIKNRDSRIGMCLDVGHQRRAGKDPVAAIKQYASRIYDVHLKNIKIDGKKNIAMPGPRGELDIYGILQALADIGYDGVCHIEYDSDLKNNFLQLAESVGYYRGVMAMIKDNVVMEAVPAGANTLSAEEKAQGYELLFDGKNLPVDKWIGVRERFLRFPHKGWYVSNGALSMRPTSCISNGTWVDLPEEDKKLGGGGDIVTKKKYKDFIFKFDFRTAEAANSGVKYFYDERQNKGSSEEYQILDSAHPLYSKQGTDNQLMSSLYDLIPAKGVDGIVRKTGKWNSGMIVSKGNKVEHWLNGVKVLEYVRGGEEFRKAVKSSKYRNWGRNIKRRSQPWGEIEEGRLLLQDHGDSSVSFCNLKIKPL